MPITQVVNYDTTNAEKSMGQLRKELKSYKETLLNAEEGTERYNVALAKAAELQFKMKEMNELVRSSSGDLGEVLKGSIGVLGGLAGGFAAVQGLMGIFGSESEELTKILTKVASSIALMQGLEGLEGLTKKIPILFNQLKALTQGMSALKTAIAATGIGLLVIAVGLLASNFDKVLKFLNPNIEKSAKLKENYANLNVEYEKFNKNLEQNIAIMKLMGVDNVKIIDEQIANYDKLIKKQDEKINLLQKDADIQSKWDKKKEILDKIEEERQKKKELYDKQELLFYEKQNAQREKEKKNYEEIQEKEKKLQEEKEKNREKELEKEKELAEKKKELFYEIGEAGLNEYELEKKHNDEAMQQALESLVLNEEEKLKIKNYYIEKNRLVDEEEAEYKKKLKEEEDEKKKEEDEKKLEEDENKKALLDEYRIAEMEDIEGQREILRLQQEEDLAAFEYTEEEKNRIKNYYTNKNKELDKLEKQSKLETLSAVGDMLGQAASLFKKNSKMQKALAISQTVIETIQSASKSYNSLASIPVVGPVLGGVAAAIAAAAGVARIAKIKSQKIGDDGGGDSGGGGDVSGIATGVAPTAASPASMLTQEQNTILTQSSVKTLQEPTKVYVLEGDITKEQNKVKVTQNESTLGG